MPISPDRSVRSGATESSGARKKRTIVVVRRQPHNVNGSHDNGLKSVPRRKTLMVSRRPRPSEERLFDNAGPKGKGCGVIEGTNFSSGRNLRWGVDGRVVERSILGSADAFEEVDAQLGHACVRPADDNDSGEGGGGSVRSLQTEQSRQSKQSRRSSISRRQSTGHCSNGGQESRSGGSRSGISSEEQVGLQRHIRSYIQRILEAEETARKNRAENFIKETKLLGHIGLTEKLTLRREGNAMRQWERRQRDWLRVREDMVAKTGKVEENLVMSTADDFRERSETYQLVQSAIPANEKCSSEGHWVMSLRGYGERMCNVGNMFSGLFCAIDGRVPPIKTVRKPTGRAADASRKRTWRNSDALALRQRQLAPALKRLRPALLPAEETRGLLIQGQDLLEWAATSSEEYFELRQMQELQSEVAELRELESVEAEAGQSLDAGDVDFSLQARSGPVMELISPKFLLIESNAGAEDLAQSTVTVRNAGSTVIYFMWSRLARGENVVSRHGNIDPSSGILNGDGDNTVKGMPIVDKGLAVDGIAGEAPRFCVSYGRSALATRHAALQSPDPHFLCHKAKGMLLPGESTTTSFSFKSADAGVFSDRWRLETVPPASFVFSSPPVASRSLRYPGNPSLDAPTSSSSFHRGDFSNVGLKDRSGNNRNKDHLPSYNSNQDEERGSAGHNGRIDGMESEPRGAEIGLRGVALSPDTREHARRRLSKEVERGVLAAKVEEIVRKVVCGVRTPVRKEEIRRRQREAFLSANSERGLYFTPQLYDSFAGLLQRAQSVALAAEAGEYDQATSDVVDEPETEDEQHYMLTRAQKDDVAAQELEKSEKLVVGEKDDELSISSSKAPSPSDSSTTVMDGGDSDHDSYQDRRTEKNPRQTEAGDQRSGTTEQNAKGDDQSRCVSDDHETMPANVANKVDGTATVADARNEHTCRQEDIEATNMEVLKGMLEKLDCGHWNGAVNVVLEKIEDLSRWIPESVDALADEEQAVVGEAITGTGETELTEHESGGVRTNLPRATDGENQEGAMDDGGQAGGVSDRGTKEEDEDEDEDEDEEEEENEQEDDDEVGADDGGDGETDADGEFIVDEEKVGEHPVVREQRLLRAQWRRLLLDAELEPDTSIHGLMRTEVVSMIEAIPGAVEEARREVGGLPGGTPVTPRGRSVLGYDEDIVKNWAEACPVNTFADVEGGPHARALALAKGGNPLASFLAFAFGTVGAEIGAVAERFEANLAVDAAGRRLASTARRRIDLLQGPASEGRRNIASSTSPPSLARLAVLSRSDIEGRRLLLHVDLSQTSGELSLEEGIDARRGGIEKVQIGRSLHDAGKGLQMLFPEAVQLVAEQVRGMLSAKPAAVAIVSDAAPALVSVATTNSMPGTNTGSPQPPPSLAASGSVEALSLSSTAENVVDSTRPSLRETAIAVSTLLGMDVEFYDTVPEMAGALGRCRVDGSDASFGARVMMVEGLDCAGVLPAPTEVEPDLSDEEDERLPDFCWGGEEAEAAAEEAKVAEAERLKRDGPDEGDLGEMLAGTVDVTVLDAPQTLYRPKRKIPWGPAPTTGLVVAGTGLHGDLNAMAYLTETPDRPLLAIVGGRILESRLKLIDGLLDLVDTLAVGGELSVTFLAAMGIKADDAIGCSVGSRKRMRRWGKGCAGLPRDPPEVFIAARRLLVKARKRRVEVILPSDFVVGDIEVDEFGPLPGQTRPEEDEDEARNEEENESDIVTEKAQVAGGESVTDDGRRAEGTSGAAEGKEDDSAGAGADLEQDPAMGFEYDGETMDVSLEDGIPRGFRAMDIGPQTTTAFKDAVSQARGILWHGLLGVAECTAFQNGTRDVLEATTAAHDSDELRVIGASPVVVLCGRSLGEWAVRLVEAEDDAPRLGAGSGVSHICADPPFCSRVLEGRFIQGLGQLSERDPAQADADLRKVLRRRPFEEDEDDDEEDGERESDDDSDA